MQIQRNAASSAHLDEADKFDERAPHTVDTIEQCHLTGSPSIASLSIGLS